MASSLLPIYASVNSTNPSPRFHVSNYSTNRILSTTLLLRRSPLLSGSNPNACSALCRATTPGGPSPPESGPPNGSDPSSSSATFSRFQDSVQIFFAVLFWMSLFFWASIWDGMDNGRSNKGSRF